jgi:hypothetical protein
MQRHGFFYRYNAFTMIAMDLGSRRLFTNFAETTTRIRPVLLFEYEAFVLVSWGYQRLSASSTLVKMIRRCLFR